MKLLVSIEGHFKACGDEVYSHHLTYDKFWSRYLKAFESVVVAARLEQVSEPPSGWKLATGRGVSFCKIPEYVGPKQYLSKRSQVLKVLKQQVDAADAYLIRVPGNIGNIIWKLIPSGYPFGVEVVVDPWEIFSPVGIRSIARPAYRWLWTYYLKKQCKQAAVASYVTEFALQKRYPASKSAFTTHYSSISMTEEDVANDAVINSRMSRLDNLAKRLSGEGDPVKLGFVGSFSQNYKLPDIHIKAFAECVKRGLNIEMEMIGDGRLLSTMKSLADKLNVSDKIVFRGKIPGGKPVFDALDTFDLFLNATAAEGLPRAMIEALARGCPSIGSRVVGIPELVPDDCLVYAGNVESLANVICNILSDDVRMKNLVKVNITRALDYVDSKLNPRREKMYYELKSRTELFLNKK